jgi:trehalose 6-phosphate phosphatase
LLLLDFDGTLVPMIDNPDAVDLSQPTQQVLRRLARHPGSSVYIMSGRRLADLRRRVKIPGVRLLGLHGWERRGARLPDEQKQLLHRAKIWLVKNLPNLPGIRIEDKGYALAVHYRGAKQLAVKCAKQVLRAARDHFRPGLRLLKGINIWELLPQAIGGKGHATQRLLKGIPDDTLAIFVGDDTSDESAFGVVQHGLAIHVGGRRSKAHFSLRDPDEVGEFLERLEAVMSR